MLPNAIVAGVPKAGTTSIHRWITDHPDVLGPTSKETGYFVDRTSHAFNPQANFLDHGVDGYRRLFEPAGDRAPQAVIEVAPDYMCQQTAIQYLPDLAGKPLIIFVLREPAAQIYSLFNYLKHNWNYLPADMSFTRFVELARSGSGRLARHELLRLALDNGRYADVLDRWQGRCGSDRLRVWLFEDLVRDSRAFMQRMARTLGVDPSFYDDYAFPRENETYRVRLPLVQKLNVAVRKKLPKGPVYFAMRDVYRRLNTRGAAPVGEEDAGTLDALRADFAVDNARLATRYGVDLSAWRSPEPV